MKRFCIRLWLAVFELLVCGRLFAQVSSASSPAPTKSALLIGIWTYEHPSAEIKVPDGAPHTGRYEPALTYSNLKGPKYDVEEMRTLLTSERFGFPNDDKHIHILLDKDATHDAILEALQDYLVKNPHAGDTVVLYISSHGSLRADPKGHGELYDLDGTGRHPSSVENTIVPYDWYLGVDDVFSRDLRHVFNEAADRNIHVTAIFDTCHSGSLARGAEDSGLVPRAFDFDPRPMPADPYPEEAAGTPPEARSVNPVLVLSAAQKDQSTIDVENSVPPHGLFTNALIETLRALPANRSADEVFRRVQIAMELAPGASHQQPELDTSNLRRQEPLFGGSAGSGPLTATVVWVDGSGALLDVGTVADIGAGSEFTTLTETNGVRAVLRVSDSIGLSRSRATVISAPGSVVHVEDVVELTKWVPAERPTLKFYAGVSNLTLAQIREAISVSNAAGMKLIRDPSVDAWTHHLLWDGTRWIVKPHTSKGPGGQVKMGKTVVLGARLSAGALRKLPAGGAIWFDAPLPGDPSRALMPSGDDVPRSAAVLTSDRTQATYVIAGTATGNGVGYAWFKRSDLDAEIQTPKEIGLGCSPNSAYPLRTKWVVADGTVRLEIPLTDFAVQLARLNGWLHLQTASLGGQVDFPYRLGLRRVGENADLADNGDTYQGEYELSLIATRHAAATPRWVYVLVIDCQGKGSLLWPYKEVPPGKFPKENGTLDHIPLPGDPFPVDEPFGTDTYLLLTTSTPLSDPWALEFTGVVKKGGNKKLSEQLDPLEDLLDSTSAGTLSRGRPTPTNWSVEAMQTQSRKQPASNGPPR